MDNSRSLFSHFFSVRRLLAMGLMPGLLFCVEARAAGPDAFGYVSTDSLSGGPAFTFTDLSATGTHLTFFDADALPTQNPTSPAVSNSIGSVAEIYREFAFTAAANVTGQPAMHLPGAEGILDGGDHAMKGKDWRGAERIYRDATRKYPGYAWAWQRLAESLEAQGRKDEAGQCAARARKLGGS